MSQFLYFAPGGRLMNPARAVARGLSYALKGQRVTSNELAGQGPGGHRGVIFGFGMDAAECRYLPGEQCWEQMPESDLWLGFDAASPPTAADLARDRQVDGHLVILADGRDWLVPVARALDGTSPLPKRLRWDGRRWTRGEVQHRYAELFSNACRAWDALIEGGEDGAPASVDFDISDECDLAALALAVNYRIGPAEISALGLFDDTTERQVLEALIDWPVFEQLMIQKKTVSAVTGPVPGGGA